MKLDPDASSASFFGSSLGVGAMVLRTVNRRR